MKKVGILGGTFNPVHNEHIALVLSAIKELELDKLLVMPTYISPHKTDLPASAEHRLAMLKLAFSGVDKVEVSDYEIEKQGKSYTYQTVEHFYKEDQQLYFIMGGDMLVDFKNWKYPERILDKCTLAVFSRQNFGADFEKEREYFIKTFNKDFLKLNYIGKDASSTKIRTYAKLGLEIDDLTDKKVADYIKENQIYESDVYQLFVMNNLPQKRLKHTADVVICALKKAKQVGLDNERVSLACTLHDLAKYMDYTSFNGFNLPQGVPKPVVHAFLGAFVAEKHLKIQDQEIIDAIRYHTSGKANMTDLAKLVFVADMLEEGRSYDGVEKLREIYENSDLDTAFIECLKEEYVHLLNKGQEIYIETKNAYDYYIKQT